MSTFILKGRWIGEPSTPARSFHGTVEHAGDTGMQAGEPVVVTFDAEPPHPHGPDHQAHGRYRLTGLPDDRFVLVGFVRKDGGTSKDAEPEDEPQLWGGDLFVR